MCPARTCGGALRFDYAQTEVFEMPASIYERRGIYPSELRDPPVRRRLGRELKL
jgi:hypothetical protein